MNLAEKPSDQFYEAANAAARRVKNRQAQISRAFIRSEKDHQPPLARCLRGGRGGEVRLKLLLSMLWIAAKEPHDTSFPARAWAELLGLEDPAGRGTRRVQDAIDWLSKNKFIRLEKIPGLPSKIYLLDETTSGADYKIPGSGKGRSYVKLPATFWTRGWIAILSGSAVALLLIFLDQLQGGGPTASAWLSPSRSKELFSLSPDTWSRAVKELVDHGLITFRRRPTRSSDFGLIRLRNVYQLNEVRLESEPA